MTVYIVRAGAEGPVKIGWAAVDVHARLASLAPGNPEPLALLRVLPGGIPTERWMHRQFASLCRRGEWFTFDAAMLTIEPPVLAVTDRVARPAPETPASRIIAKFGGIRPMARALGLDGHMVVYQWKRRGLISARYQPRILQAARELGIDVGPADFFDPPPADAPPAADRAA